MPTAAPTPPAPATNPIATAAEASTSSRTVTIPGWPEVGTNGAFELPGACATPAVASLLIG